MTAQVLVTLSDNVYERVQQLAKLRQLDIAEIVETVLSDALFLHETKQKNLLDAAESDISRASAQKQALKREKAAYIKLHPWLKERYFGRHVAIYGGELVDVDADFGTLYERVRSRFPNQVVLMTKVSAESTQTIRMRSPRLVPRQSTQSE